MQRFLYVMYAVAVWLADCVEDIGFFRSRLINRGLNAKNCGASKLGSFLQLVTIVAGM